MKGLMALVIVALLVAACHASESDTPAAPPQPSPTIPDTPAAPPSPTIRLLFVGDVMPARDVAPVIAAEGVEVFAEVRATIGEADLAFGNLEAALSADVDAGELVADPAAAALLAAAGFDVLSVANNHADDAGSVEATAAEIDGAGMTAIGVPGADPAVVGVGGLAVAMLAFDLTDRWDRDRATGEVAAARSLADVVVVSVHGGVELLADPDPALEGAVTALAGAGADVVWAHGAHVAYPIDLIDPDGDGRQAVAAYGLGNFLFDQRLPRTTSGLLLEVLATEGGVTGLRAGVASHEDLRLHFDGWLDPGGDAVSIAGEWWAVASAVGRLYPDPIEVELEDSVVSATGFGPVTGDPAGEVVVAFRRPFRPTAVNQQFPDVTWTDSSGRSAHLGLYRPETLEEVWVAGSVPRPIGALAVCDGAIAVSYSDLDGATGSVAGGGWHWSGFGFELSPDLHGAAVPTCADVDGDGERDPVVLRGGVVGLYEMGSMVP